MIVAVSAIALVAVIAIANMPQTVAADPNRSPRPIPTFTFSTADEATDLPQAMFFGDSYSQGVGASTQSSRWTTIVSRKHDWDERNEAFGGTGYTATAGLEGCGRSDCPNYVEAVAAAPDASPAIVFVAGGQNDFSRWANEPDVVRDAINRVYADISEKYPDARIIAVGPSIIGPVNDVILGIDGAVQDAAERVGADYISLLEPDVLDESMDIGDGGHVDDAGHRAIADAVLAGL